MLVDTHCHIQDVDYPLNVEEVLQRARAAGVQKMICVGTDEESSAEALKFIQTRDDIYASIGVHPHETKEGFGKIKELADQNRDHETAKLVAVGEIGLDYFYAHSPREVQLKALEAQIQVALDHNLPIIFHVREAFDDFWPIFDNFQGIRGELHSFTDTSVNLEKGLQRGLFIGVNGISTFTKDPLQQELFAHVPLERLLLETDAPFLTPAPKRGTVNEPAFVGLVAEFQAKIREIPLQTVIDATTVNATKLFIL